VQITWYWMKTKLTKCGNYLRFLYLGKCWLRDRPVVLCLPGGSYFSIYFVATLHIPKLNNI
jgi:hypothetical protein